MLNKSDIQDFENTYYKLYIHKIKKIFNIFESKIKILSLKKGYNFSIKLILHLGFFISPMFGLLIIQSRF